MCRELNRSNSGDEAKTELQLLEMNDRPSFSIFTAHKVYTQPAVVPSYTIDGSGDNYNKLEPKGTYLVKGGGTNERGKKLRYVKKTGSSSSSSETGDSDVDNSSGSDSSSDSGKSAYSKANKRKTDLDKSTDSTSSAKSTKKKAKTPTKRPKKAENLMAAIAKSDKYTAKSQMKIARENMQAHRETSKQNGKLLLQIASMAQSPHAAQATVARASSRRDAMTILADMEKCDEKMASHDLSAPLKDLYAQQYARLQQELEQSSL
jgi:hypothetical protein